MTGGPSTLSLAGNSFWYHSMKTTYFPFYLNNIVQNQPQECLVCDYIFSDKNSRQRHLLKKQEENTNKQKA
jgi:hypothetical protein